MNRSSLGLSKTSPNREQPCNSPQRLAISFRTAAQGFFAVGLILCLCISTEAQLVKKDLDSLDGVGIDEKLDTLLPMELSFKNSAGKSIQIADLLKTRPSYLAFAELFRLPNALPTAAERFSRWDARHEAGTWQRLRRRQRQY